jgi:Zn-finger nucleic acid-binding protein
MNPAAQTTLSCGNCDQGLQVLPLSGHYGHPVEVDLCPGCHLVWFDAVESARLPGPALLELIGQMAAAQELAHQPMKHDLACPRCRGRVRTVHNQTRWGRSLQMECAQRHGAWQTFGQFLNEKGLLRPMSSADRSRALARDGALHCVNCGGTLGQTDTLCPFCATVPAVVDVARLARALDPEGATSAHSVHRTGTASSALRCQACGAAQGLDEGWQCGQCGATLTAPDLAEAHRQVSALGPALAAHAQRPAPHVVEQRLKAQSAGLERQRARAAEMQAEADARNGAHDFKPFGRDRLGGRRLDPAERLLERWLRDRYATLGLPDWVPAALLAGLLLLAWWW